MLLQVDAEVRHLAAGGDPDRDRHEALQLAPGDAGRRDADGDERDGHHRADRDEQAEADAVGQGGERRAARSRERAPWSWPARLAVFRT